MTVSDAGRSGSVERIVVYWTLVDGDGGTLICELQRTPSGLQICCYGRDGDVVRTGRLATAADGLSVAGQWKTALMAKGKYSERSDARLRPGT